MIRNIVFFDLIVSILALGSSFLVSSVRFSFDNRVRNQENHIIFHQFWFPKRVTNGGHHAKHMYLLKIKIELHFGIWGRAPEVCEPRWRTSECNMCTRLGLGHNFRYKYYERHLASLQTHSRTKIREIGIKLWPNPNLLPMLRFDVRHFGSHTSGAPEFECKVRTYYHHFVIVDFCQTFYLHFQKN